MKLSHTLILASLLSSYCAFSVYATQNSLTQNEDILSPKNASEVFRFCDGRMKTISEKEHLFTSRPRPNLPSQLSQPNEHIDNAEESKKNYREMVNNLNDFYQEEKSKIDLLSPNTPDYKQAIEELYDNCKQLTDNVINDLSDIEQSQ